jgi:hypothetical protein
MTWTSPPASTPAITSCPPLMIIEAFARASLVRVPQRRIWTCPSRIRTAGPLVPDCAAARAEPPTAAHVLLAADLLFSITGHWTKPDTGTGCVRLQDLPRDRTSSMSEMPSASRDLVAVLEAEGLAAGAESDRANVYRKVIGRSTDTNRESAEQPYLCGPIWQAPRNPNPRRSIRRISRAGSRSAVVAQRGDLLDAGDVPDRCADLTSCHSSCAGVLPRRCPGGETASSGRMQSCTRPSSHTTPLTSR